MQTYRVDLGEYRSEGVRAYIGHDRGKAIREASILGSLSTVEEDFTVEIHVPEDTYVLASSFVWGLLGPEIRGMGESEFRSRYRFTGRDVRSTVNSCFDHYNSPSPFENPGR